MPHIKDRFVRGRTNSGNVRPSVRRRSAKKKARNAAIARWSKYFSNETAEKTPLRREQNVGENESIITTHRNGTIKPKSSDCDKTNVSTHMVNTKCPIKQVHSSKETPRRKHHVSTMDFQCCVFKCTQHSTLDNPVSLFQFPKIKENVSEAHKILLRKRRQAWLNAINRKNMNIEKLDGFRVCSAHFVEGKPSHFLQVEHPDWVPSLQLGYGNTSSAQSVSKLKVYSERLKKRESMKCNQEVFCEEQLREISHDVNVETIQTQMDDVPEGISESETGISTQTDLKSDDIYFLQEENVRLREQISKLQHENDALSCAEELFKNDDHKLKKNYTGIPNMKLFNVLFGYMNDALTVVEIKGMNNACKENTTSNFQ